MQISTPDKLGTCGHSNIEEDPSLPHKHTCLWMIFWWFSPRYMIIMYHLFPQVYELLADNDDNSDPVFLHSHLQDRLPPVHSQDWMGIPVLPRSWPVISECSFQDLRILRITVYRNREIQQWSSWNWSTKYITQSENCRSFNEITMMTKSWFASSHNWWQWSWGVSFPKQGRGWWWWWWHCGYHRY